MTDYFLPHDVRGCLRRYAPLHDKVIFKTSDSVCDYAVNLERGVDNATRARNLQVSTS